jgi:hypothetical protein
MNFLTSGSKSTATCQRTATCRRNFSAVFRWLGRRPLLLQRLPQFGEQPRVLNGDDGLRTVGEMVSIGLVALLLIAPVVGWVANEAEQLLVRLKLKRPRQSFWERLDKTKEIRWCKNCEHYRPSERYENIIGGLWTAKSMQNRSDLPCDIADNAAAEVWERYFLGELNSRALYPKDCPLFQRP